MISFNDPVEGESRSCLALTGGAVAALDEEKRCGDSVASITAGAAAIERCPVNPDSGVVVDGRWAAHGRRAAHGG